MTTPLYHIFVSRIPDTNQVRATITRGDDEPVTLTGASVKGAEIKLGGHKFLLGWISADRTRWEITCRASDVRIMGTCESRGGVLRGVETSYDPGRFALPGEKQ